MRNYLIIFGVALSSFAFFGGMNSKIPIAGAILEPENHYAVQALETLEYSNELMISDKSFEYLSVYLPDLNSGMLESGTRICPQQLRLVITGSNMDLSKANPKSTPIWITCNGQTGSQVAELEQLKKTVVKQVENNSTGWAIFAHIVAMLLFVLALLV